MKTQDNNTQASTSLVQVTEQPDLSLDGELNISDYVQDVPASPKTTGEVGEWVRKKREVVRTSLAMRLVTVFGGTLTASFVLMGVAAFVPSADKSLIKDLIPQVITPQATLLGVTLGFYFTNKEEK